MIELYPTWSSRLLKALQKIYMAALSKLELDTLCIFEKQLTLEKRVSTLQKSRSFQIQDEPCRVV